MINLKHLRTLAEAATRGEWNATSDFVVANDVRYIVEKAHGANFSDLDYIAAACPDAILDLLDQHEKLLAEFEAKRPPLVIPVFTIMKNIPVPPKRDIENMTEVARTMEIGDCIDIPFARRAFAGNMERATGHTKKFTQRRIKEHGIDVIRVWRIA